VARAVFNKGAILSARGNQTEAIKAFDDVLEKLKDAEEPELKQQFVIALCNKGMALGKDGNSTEANIIYDELIKQFKKSEDPVIKEQVANARFYKNVSYHF
jgi:tetratricopeptide (TPR) repeat protein